MWILSIWSCLLALVIVRGEMMTFDKHEKKLRFTCPTKEIEGEIFNVFLIRINDNGHDTTLAEWSSASKGVKTMDRRLRITDAQSPDMLGATLESVTCHDAGIYQCAVKALTEKSGTQIIPVNDSFTYIGGGKPTLSPSLLKDCYNIEDTITLNCTADIETDENDIIWEAKPPGGRFSEITQSVENVKTPDPANMCSIMSHSSLTYTLGKEDLGKTFQCRLRESGHKIQLTLPGQCAVSTEDRVERILTTTTRDAPEEKSGVNMAAEPAVLGAVHETESDSSNSTEIIVPVVVIVLVGVVIGLLVWRRRRKHSGADKRNTLDLQRTQPQGYPSFNNSDRYVSRTLPDLPGPSLDNIIVTPDPLNDAAFRPNTLDICGSGYITMTSNDLSPTATNSDIGASGGSRGNRSAEMEPKSEEEGLLNSEDEGPAEDEDEVEPRMRTSRLYSNSDVVDQSGVIVYKIHADNASGDPHVTNAKIFY